MVVENWTHWEYCTGWSEAEIQDGGHQTWLWKHTFSRCNVVLILSTSWAISTSTINILRQTDYHLRDLRAASDDSYVALKSVVLSDKSLDVNVTYI